MDGGKPSPFSRQRQAREDILRLCQRRCNSDWQIDAQLIVIIRFVSPLAQPVQTGRRPTALFRSQMVPQAAMIIGVAARIELQIIPRVVAGIAKSRIVSPAERGTEKCFRIGGATRPRLKVAGEIEEGFPIKGHWRLGADGNPSSKEDSRSRAPAAAQIFYSRGQCAP